MRSPAIVPAAGKEMQYNDGMLGFKPRSGANKIRYMQTQISTFDENKQRVIKQHLIGSRSVSLLIISQKEWTAEEFAKIKFGDIVMFDVIFNGEKVEEIGVFAFDSTFLPIIDNKGIENQLQTFIGAVGQGIPINFGDKVKQMCWKMPPSIEDGEEEIYCDFFISYPVDYIL
jgi:hypothetical protein